MSQDAVGRFLELIETDEALEKAMDEVAEQEADLVARAVELGHERGLDFSRDEFAAVLEQFRKEHFGELDDAELAGVSGGFTPQPEPPGVYDKPISKSWKAKSLASKKSY